MDVEGSTSELANRGRSEEETAQLRNIPRLFSKYSKIPNKATSKRSTSVRSQLLKYLEITNNGEHFNENIFEFWETMENQLYTCLIQTRDASSFCASVIGSCGAYF